MAIGDPLVQAFTAEHHAESKQVVVSPMVWSHVSKFFKANNVTPDKHAFLEVCTYASYMHQPACDALTMYFSVSIVILAVCV